MTKKDTLSGINEEIGLEEIKDMAAESLHDEIWPIEDKLEKACLIMQEIEEEYFNKYNNGKKEDGFGIIYNHSRYELFTKIVSDYIYGAKKEIKVLCERGRINAE